MICLFLLCLVIVKWIVFTNVQHIYMCKVIQMPAESSRRHKKQQNQKWGAILLSLHEQ